MSVMKVHSLILFLLFWGDDLCDLLVKEMNPQAANMKTAKPNTYVAKNWTDCTVVEMKAFFCCRVGMEMLIHKECYEYDWKSNCWQDWHTKVRYWR